MKFQSCLTFLLVIGGSCGINSGHQGTMTTKAIELVEEGTESRRSETAHAAGVGYPADLPPVTSIGSRDGRGRALETPEASFEEYPSRGVVREFTASPSTAGGFRPSQPLLSTTSSQRAGQHEHSRQRVYGSHYQPPANNQYMTNGYGISDDLRAPPVNRYERGRYQKPYTDYSYGTYGVNSDRYSFRDGTYYLTDQPAVTSHTFVDLSRGLQQHFLLPHFQVPLSLPYLTRASKSAANPSNIQESQLPNSYHAATHAVEPTNLPLTQHYISPIPTKPNADHQNGEVTNYLATYNPSIQASGVHSIQQASPTHHQSQMLDILYSPAPHVPTVYYNGFGVNYKN